MGFSIPSTLWSITDLCVIHLFLHHTAYLTGRLEYINIEQEYYNYADLNQVWLEHKTISE